MLPLLALLLVRRGTLGSGSSDSARGWGDGALEVCQWAEERVLAELGQGGSDVESCAVLAEDGIGVLDVCGRERLDRILESRKTGDDLRWTISLCAQWL